MYKYGDKIKCTHTENDTAGLTVGNIYTVDKPCGMRITSSDDGWVCIQVDDSGKHNGFNLKYYGFMLVERRKEITNDIDWLDRIQLNFKD